MLTTIHKTIFSSPKVVYLSEAGPLAEGYRDQGMVVGLCHGGFDLLHPGHVRHFQSAQGLCDRLFVSLTSDRYVALRKGAGRPVYSEKLRAYMIASLSYVDHVFVADYETAIESIQAVRPDKYIKGKDFARKSTPGITSEREVVRRYGGTLVFTEDPKLSASEIITHIQSHPKPKLLLVVDRDGTLITNNDFFGKDSDWKDQLSLNDPVVGFVSKLQSRYRCTTIVVTNQSGVARGLFSEARVRQIHAHIVEKLADQNVQIDSWKYCPDMDKQFVADNSDIDVMDAYIKERTKRKPSPVMVKEGLEELGSAYSDYDSVVVIGDRKEDKELAYALKAIYIDVKDRDFPRHLSRIQKQLEQIQNPTIAQI